MLAIRASLFIVLLLIAAAVLLYRPIKRFTLAYWAKLENEWKVKAVLDQQMREVKRLDAERERVARQSAEAEADSIIQEVHKGKD